MIKRYVKIFCDNCGKKIVTLDKTPLTIADFAKVNVYARGKQHFCSKECYQDWKLHKSRSQRSETYEQV